MVDNGTAKVEQKTREIAIHHCGIVRAVPGTGRLLISFDEIIHFPSVSLNQKDLNVNQDFLHIYLDSHLFPLCV